ncbi:DUF4142 domain-containing protein [Ramlibacter sp. AN1133]|uniref:DUF4142 domain-containing protein n=1 Tax=Ramlibacter sp. AN1133 TaxID=3133429 RepID=UPI0030C1FB81
MWLRWPRIVLLVLTLVQGLPAPAAPRDAAADISLVAGRKDARLQQWQFMRRAAAAAHSQVIAGKLASIRGSTPEVRAFGRQLMNRRQKTGRRLALLSLRTQVPLPSRPDTRDRAAIGRLRSLRGEEFDRLFLKHFGVEVQERELSLYRSLLRHAVGEPGLRRLAQQASPAVARHLEAARKLLHEDQQPGPRDLQPPMPGASADARTSQQEVRSSAAGRSAGWDAEEREAMEGISRAADVLRRMKQDPRMDMLVRRAHGVLLFPQYRRAGVVLGVRAGQGVLVTRTDKGFSAPAFYRMEGGSLGLQAGAASGVTAYLLMTEIAVQQFRTVRQISFDAFSAVTLGPDSQQWQSSKGKVQDVVVWSGTRGAYAGAGVGMTQIVPDAQANRAYYGRDVSTAEILGGAIPNPHENVLEDLLGS